jgi:hypothetical protein
VVDDISGGGIGVRYHGARRRQSKAAGEDRQSAQGEALRLGEQLVAPVECCPQRVVARQRPPLAAGEQVKPIIEPGRDLCNPERSTAGRCQLDRQRDAVETPANYCRGGRIRPLRVEVRIGRAGARDQQAHRTVAQHLLDILDPQCRHCEGRYPVEAFSLRPQRLAAGGQHPHCRVTTQQRLRDFGRRRDQVLAIVEHE